MFDIGWSEMLIVGALALIVVGPSDLPRLMRSVGQWVGKARSLARDFQRSMNDAAREADLAELKELRSLKDDLAKAADARANPLNAAFDDEPDADQAPSAKAKRRAERLSEMENDIADLSAPDDEGPSEPAPQQPKTPEKPAEPAASGEDRGPTA